MILEYRKFLIGLICCLLLFALTWSAPLIAQESTDDQTLEESLEEDPLAEDEDPLADDEADPIAEDEDPSAVEEADPLFADESEEAEEEKDPLVDEETYPIKTTIKSSQRLIGGHTELQKGGVGRENESNLEITYHLINAYQFTGRIQTSPYHFYHLRLMTYFNQKYDEANQQYTDDFTFQLREAYYNGQNGNHRYTIGAQIFKLGKVDFDSPVDVLTPQNSRALEYLDFDESKEPVVGVKYDWLGENQTVTAYFAPLKQKTPGTEYTIFENEQREKETGEEPDDRTVARSHFGIQYQYTFDIADVRFGVFRWADPNNKITWQDPDKPSSTDVNTETDEETDEETIPEPESDSTSVEGTTQSYQEVDTTTNFATLEFDITLGDFVVKWDTVFFQEKNVYHFYQKPDNTTEFFTLRVKHLAFAVSIEKKFRYFFLMPSYTYRLLYDVPENTHILTYADLVTCDRLST